MKRIGITGGIGSGKSAVTNLLRETGYYVIDADEVSREAAMPGEPAILRLREEFGDDIFFKDGVLDRQELARVIFSDPNALGKVNDIFHGDIIERIEKRIKILEWDGVNPVFIAAPLLFETGADRIADEIWLVTADEETRLKRVMDRDGLSAEEVRSRIESQMPEDEKRLKADIVIENDGTFEKLCKEVELLLKTC